MVTFYRRLPKFDYVKPKSLDEALDYLASNKNGTVRIYAGGTDVIPKLKSRLISTPEVLMDLKGVLGLDYIDYDEKIGLKIGALATIFSVAQAPVVRENFPILAQAANSIAATQVQNRGTIIGNICNAVPSADSAPALLCLEAKLVCASKRGERELPIEDFFTGPNETALNPDEMVKEILIPPMPVGSYGVYFKLSPRSRMDLAVVGVGAVVSGSKDSVTDARIALGAVAPTPIRCKNAEEILKGGAVDDKRIEEAGKSAADASKPIDDHRASAQYRRMMVDVLVKRAIRQAIAN